jgi:hypothetical protein
VRASLRRHAPSIRSALVVAVLALAGCPRAGGVHGPGAVGASFTGCLPLVGNSRASLRLSPDRAYLYWTEQVRLHGYEDAWPSTAVVRWPIDGGGPAERLTNLIENPYRLMADGRVIGFRKDAGVTVWSPTGAELVSLSSSIDHFELLASEKAVVYLSAGAIWRQPVTREAARWVARAESLLGVTGELAVIEYRDADANAHLALVDLNSGKQTDLPYLEDVTKAIGAAFITATSAGIGVRPLVGGATKTVLTGDMWQTRPAPDGLKAWRRDGTRLDAAIVTGAGADTLPPVVGGDSLEGFVRLPDGRVAYLVGHDLDGDDEVTTGDEVDLCLAARGAKELRVEPRAAPLRWRKAGDAIAALARDRFGGGSWHFSSGDEVQGLFIDSKVARSGEADIRADVRATAELVARTTGDETIYLELTYPDGRRGRSEWWAWTGRRITWEGMGNAIVPELKDYAVTFAATFETQTAAEEGAGGEGAGDGEGDGDGDVTRVRCTGTVTNQSDHQLIELYADCVGGDDDAKIPVTPRDLAPGQVGRYDDVVQRKGDAVLAVSIHTGPGYNEVAGFDLARHARLAKVRAAAEEVADRADLIYKESAVGTGHVTVTLTPRVGQDFGRWSGQAQEAAVATAQDVLQRIGGKAFGGEDGDRIGLRISAGEQTWRYEDGQLTSDDDE